jgi:MFS family permease
LVLAPLGFIAACIAAGAMATVGIFGIEHLDAETVGWYAGGMIAGMFWAGAVAFFPSLVAIVLAEALGWRSVFFYLLVGGAIGAVAAQTGAVTEALDFAESPTVALIAAGFAGGFTYWLIAGKGYSSGSPRRPA